MDLFAQAAALARAGRPHEGVALIERAAEAGDAEGNLILAHWLLYGSDRARDCVAAHRHLALAAAKGRSDALRMQAHLVASGTGCVADQEKAIAMLREAASIDRIAAEELAALAQLRSVDNVSSLKRERVSNDPHIEIVHSLLSPEECAYIIRRAEPLLKPSFVDDGKTGRGRPDPIRTSHGAAFVPHEADLVVQAISQRIATATATSGDHAEALYVMRYTPGQQYRPHHDSLPGLKNQREWTAIAYLNDGFEGGATSFPDLGLSLRGRIGDLLIFRNSNEAGEPDSRMRHAGEPVTSGDKWIATRWIRHGLHDPYDRG